MCGSAESVEFV